MSPVPTFSVVVPSYNRPAALAQCLRALAGLDYPRDRYEVIVVDDGGSSDLGTIIEPFMSQVDLKLLRQTNSGPAGARNTGAAAAKYEFLAFTDDDCRPHADWLAKLVGALAADPQVLAGGPTLNVFADNLYCVTAQMILDVVNAHYNHDHERSIFFPSDNIAISLALFLEIGGFDPAFRYSEDRDFCDRWLMTGRRLVFKPDALVSHARTMGWTGFCRLFFAYGRGAWHYHNARQQRRHVTFEVDGNFYLKCFLQPWQTEPVWRAIPLTVLLFVWQVANAAGFFYERFRRIAPGEAPENATKTPARSPGLPAERSSR